MRPSYPANIITSFMAQESSEGYVILLEISHPSFSPPIRVASHKTDFLSNGLTYFSFPFRIDMPGDDPETVNTVELTLDNVDPLIATGVRAIPPGSVKPTVAMTVVTMDAPDTVLIGPVTMSFVSVLIKRLDVTGSLSYDTRVEQKYPADRLTPLVAPGMF